MFTCSEVIVLTNTQTDSGENIQRSCYATTLGKDKYFLFTNNLTTCMKAVMAQWLKTDSRWSIANYLHYWWRQKMAKHVPVVKTMGDSIFR